MRELLAHIRFAGASAQITLTVSIGVASARGESADFEKLVNAADTALYEAKRQGRNRICVAEEPAVPRKSSVCRTTIPLEPSLPAPVET